jgi:hypothetical protein
MIQHFAAPNLMRRLYNKLAEQHLMAIHTVPWVT